jgi:hypothetical protein
VKHTRKILTLISCLGLFAPIAVRAEEIPELTRFVAQEIQTMSRAVDGPRQAEDQGIAFYFRQFMVRVRASVGIEVPWIASFAIVPEVELVWNRAMRAK